MTVIEPGHKYRLHTLDLPVNDYLIFVKREGPGYPGNVGHYPGTNIQDVLRCCIDRIKYLDSQIPHQANQNSMLYLRLAITELEKRAAERHGRQWLRPGCDIEDAPFCPKCGHIGCQEVRS